MLRLVLPLFPTSNYQYHYTNHGRVLTKEARAWRTVAQAIARKEIKRQKWQCPEKWVFMNMLLYFYHPNFRCRDTHNNKLLLDSLEDPNGKLVYLNDFFVLPAIQSIQLDKQNPRVEVEITISDLVFRPRRK